MNTQPTKKEIEKERPPVVVVMGHIDHGKSTLLDYIRKSNIVDGEAGGITQHLSAYEISHKDENGEAKKITFIDTPGHEAFSAMRERGAIAADVAILVISAEDGVKPQTLEAWQTITSSGISPIIAINKIDRPGANIEKTKNDLTENGIYIEGYGGDIPFIPISSKTGEGIDQLLDIVLLVSALKELKGSPSKNAEGIVIESHLDTKRGISTVLLIKDGTLKQGMFVVVDDAISATRIFEDFNGHLIKEATFSSPVRITGFSKLPVVGSVFYSFDKKIDAEKAVKDNKTNSTFTTTGDVVTDDKKRVPIIIKTDVMGTSEAIEKEIRKIENDDIGFKIIGRGVGSISEGDLKLASSDQNCIVIGFNVKIDSGARDINENLKINIETFDVIYKLIDFLKEIAETRRPRKEVKEVTGSLKILKLFNVTKDKQVVGGKVISGKITAGNPVNIIRRENFIGIGRITELQLAKIKTREITEGNECGLQIESRYEVAPGDIIESYEIVTK